MKGATRQGIHYAVLRGAVTLVYDTARRRLCVTRDSLGWSKRQVRRGKD